MLDLKIHDLPQEFRLEVRGELNRAAARELLLAWRTGQSTVRNRRAVVRLWEINIGGEGAEVLALIRREGGEVLAADQAGVARRASRFCERLCGMRVLRWWCCKQAA